MVTPQVLIGAMGLLRKVRKKPGFLFLKSEFVALPEYSGKCRTAMTLSFERDFLMQLGYHLRHEIGKPAQTFYHPQLFSRCAKKLRLHIQLAIPYDHTHTDHWYDQTHIDYYPLIPGTSCRQYFVNSWNQRNWSKDKPHTS